MISLNPAKFNRCDWFIIVWVVYYQVYYMLLEELFPLDYWALI